MSTKDVVPAVDNEGAIEFVQDAQEGLPAVEEGLLTPAAVEEGLLTPATFEEGLPTPAAVEEGLPTPAAEGLPTPAAVEEGLLTPATVEEGLLTPAAVEEGLLTLAAVEERLPAVEEGLLSVEDPTGKVKTSSASLIGHFVAMGFTKEMVLKAVKELNGDSDMEELLLGDSDTVSLLELLYAYQDKKSESDCDDGTSGGSDDEPEEGLPEELVAIEEENVQHAGDAPAAVDIGPVLGIPVDNEPAIQPPINAETAARIDWINGQLEDGYYFLESVRHEIADIRELPLNDLEEIVEAKLVKYRKIRDRAATLRLRVRTLGGVPVDEPEGFDVMP